MSIQENYKDGSWEEYAQRIKESMKDGGKPHGGNLEYLENFAPELANQIYQDIINNTDPLPANIQEFADLLEFNNEDDKKSFIDKHTKLISN